jgi:hypothetical protein
MDKKVLVEKDFDAGRRLVAALIAAGLPVAMAVWIRERGSDWRLYVASPDVQRHGPLAVHRFVRRIAEKLAIDLDDTRVSTVNTTNHFVNELSSYAGTRNQPSYVANITIGDHEIEEGQLFHFAPRAKSSPKPPKPDDLAIMKARQAA